MNLGFYLRSSTKEQEQSIENQRTLLLEYANKHFPKEAFFFFADEGYSGTNFERPGFQRLLKEVKGRKIDLILVKDLSRIGRNFLETGRYLEEIFPAYQVRVIAVTEGYDTEKLEELRMQAMLLPFRNMMNQWYARDISRKVTSQLAAKRQQGIYVGAWAPFGYEKNKGTLQIVEEEKAIVQRIFEEYVKGRTKYAIAKQLNLEQVPTPAEFQKKKEQGYHCQGTPPFHWTQNAIKRILTNEIYLGVLCQGKRTKVSYLEKTVKERPKKEWQRTRKKELQIIEEEVFCQVQEGLKGEKTWKN